MRHFSIINSSLMLTQVPSILTLKEWAWRLCVVLWLAIVSNFAPRLSAQTMSSADSVAEKVSFDAVQPILRKHCVRCHNEDQPRGDLVLSSLDKVLAGSSSGPVVVAGKLEESPLYTLTAHLETPKMPPNKPQIPQRELNIIERWIVSGLADETKPVTTKPVTTKPATTKPATTKPATTKPATTKPIPSDSKSPSDLLSPVVYAPLRAIPRASAICTLSAHPIEPVVAIAGLHQVAILNSKTAEFASQAIEIGERNISALRFSSDGKILLIAVGIVGESGTVLVLDWMTKQWLPSVGDESDNIQSIDCIEDASQFAIGTTSRLVKTFDRTTQKELHVHRKHTDWVLSVAYSPDGIVLASGDRFGGIHVWETATGKEFATLRGHTGGITGLIWSEDGNRLTSASLDGSVRIWNMHALETEKQWVAHEGGVQSLAPGPQGSIVTGGRDGWIRKWSAENAMLLWQSKLADDVFAVCHIGTAENPGALIGTDAAGGVYRFNSLTNSESERTAAMETLLPVSNLTRKFATIVPIAPKRVVKSDSDKNATESVAMSVASPSKSEKPVELSEMVVASDLEESRRALNSIEQSLEQTYRTAEQLEESVARLKQLIVLQEARLKQSELRQRSNRK